MTFAVESRAAAQVGARATRIAEILGDSPEAFMALWGDWMAKSGTSRIVEAARRSDDLVALSQRLGRDDYVLQAHQWRATMALARLHTSVGRHDKAGDMLRDNYAAFTQGFALSDLVEGRQLLEGLN